MIFQCTCALAIRPQSEGARHSKSEQLSSALYVFHAQKGKTRPTITGFNTLQGTRAHRAQWRAKTGRLLKLKNEKRRSKHRTSAHFLCGFAGGMNNREHVRFTSNVTIAEQKLKPPFVITNRLFYLFWRLLLSVKLFFVGWGVKKTF